MSANCKNCCTKFCTAAGKNDDSDICEEYTPTKTHYDEIRSMTAEELADWLVLVEQRILERQPMLERPVLYEALLDWLKQEATNG